MANASPDQIVAFEAFVTLESLVSLVILDFWYCCRMRIGGVRKSQEFYQGGIVMKAAIYCRVSTEGQEREGTSLQSQLDACLKLARERDYEVPDEFTIMETYSGLSLDRPKLNDVRQWVRNKQVDAVIAYTLDRLSRDPVHFIILQEEMEKAGVELILVTETVDSSDLGKLIMYIKGFAAKLEAEKIRERTARGKAKRVEKGLLPNGRGILYGYDYDPETGRNIANKQLDVVRMIGMWLISEGIFLNEACRRLMEKNILAPKGGIKWSRGTVGRLMRNPVYAGVSYAGRTKTVNGKRMQCSHQEWIELPNLVDKPAFTLEEWQLIQRQLDRNRELSPRRQKQQYLLKGITRCRRCGRKYYGLPVHGKPYYRCSGRIKLLSPEPCDSKTVNANWLENLVWQEIEKALRDPDLLLTYLRKQRESKDSPNHLEERLQLSKNMLKSYDEAETKYLRLYGAGVITEEKLREEASRIKKEVERITRENADLEKQLGEIQDLEINIESMRQLCGLMAKNLESLTFDDKLFALSALNVQVWIDGDSITIEGDLPKTECITASQQLSLPVGHLKYLPQHQPTDPQDLPQRQFLPWLTCC